MEIILPFYSYKTSKGHDELEYSDPRSVVLAGEGLIHATLKRCNKDLRGGWTILAEDMLGTAGFDVGTRAFVVDTSPKYPTVNLNQIKSVSGFCYATWTPIMIVFEKLFADLEVNPEITSVDNFKMSFGDKLCSRSKIKTILYLTGGFDSEPKRWRFGGNSPTSSALLREDAWNYFTQIDV